MKLGHCQSAGRSFRSRGHAVCSPRDQAGRGTGRDDLESGALDRRTSARLCGPRSHAGFTSSWRRSPLTDMHLAGHFGAPLRLLVLLARGKECRKTIGFSPACPLFGGGQSATGQVCWQTGTGLVATTTPNNNN